MTESRFDAGMRVRTDVLGEEHVARARARTTETDGELQAMALVKAELDPDADDGASQLDEPR